MYLLIREVSQRSSDCSFCCGVQIDLAGISWRKYTSDVAYSIVNKQNVLKNPVDYPVFRSYSSLAQRGVLCAWRRSIRTADASVIRTSVSAAQPETTVTTELWVFWFDSADKQGNAQSLSGIAVAPAHIQECIAPELRDPDCGSFEQGMNYEVRTVLFRALHNALERSLSRDYVRIGQWFVKPAAVEAQRDSSANSEAFAIAFHFFLHGESTVCVACDVRVAVSRFRRLSASDLRTASRCDAASGQSPGAERPRSQNTCVLAPFGVLAQLSGAPVARNDAEQRRVIECWQRLLPLQTGSQISAELPEFVEVAIRGRRLCYPSSLVLLLEQDSASNAQASTTIRRLHDDVFADANGTAVDASMRLSDVAAGRLVRNALRLGRRPPATASVMRNNDVTVNREPESATDYCLRQSLVSTAQRADLSVCTCDAVTPNVDAADAVPFHKRRKRAEETDRRVIDASPVGVDNDAEPDAAPAKTQLPRCGVKKRERVTPVRCVAMATQCILDADLDADSAPAVIVAPYQDDTACSQIDLPMATVTAANDSARLPRLPVTFLDAANERARDSLQDDDQQIMRDVLLRFSDSMYVYCPSTFYKLTLNQSPQMRETWRRSKVRQQSNRMPKIACFQNSVVHLVASKQLHNAVYFSSENTT